MIHSNVFHNDSLLPIEKVRLSPGQAGLICGWGIFTTVRISRGEAFAYERHWRRLEKDAAITRLPLSYTAAKVRVHLHEVIRANQVTEGCARIYLVYNTAGFWQSEEKHPPVDLIIYSAGLPEHREVVRLSVREHGRHAASPMSSANIFAVKNGKILTPPLSSGCLEGVTRGILMEIAPEAAVSVVEQTLRPEDLYSAEEVFISSTNRNLISVGEIAGNRIPTPGPVCERLNEIFDAYVADYISRRLASAAR